MKKKYFFRTIIFLIIIVSLVSTNSLLACTGFTAKQDGTVLIGHNKDWWSPDANIHVYPAEEGKYARLFLEIPYPHIFNNDYQVLAGGINEKGLCFESFVTPFKLASFELFKPPLFKNPVDYILQHFSRVSDVVEYIESHNLFFLNYILCSGQIFIVDSTGDAAIIEGDEIIHIQNNYQVCTNFLQSDPDCGNYPCWRYQTVTDALRNMTELTVDFFRSLLNETHLFTQYSWIYEPGKNILHLYHYHDYSNKIILDLTDEFNQSSHTYYLPSLFEPINNQAPMKPVTPTGPLTGKIGVTYYFQSNTSDNDNLPTELYYKWDFGDGTQTFWLTGDPTERSIAYSWRQSGLYHIKVKARDIYGKESPWSDPLKITISNDKTRVINFVLERLQV